MSFGARDLTIKVQTDQCPGPTGCDVQTACPGPTFCPGRSACADPSLCLPPSQCPTESAGQPTAKCPADQQDIDRPQGAAGLEALRRQLLAALAPN